MLQSLHIVNFAIIEDTIIELTDGATVFTGETGAGKSILIDALAILLGRRARTDLIRTGAEFFKVEGPEKASAFFFHSFYFIIIWL